MSSHNNGLSEDVSSNVAEASTSVPVSPNHETISEPTLPPALDLTEITMNQPESELPAPSVRDPVLESMLQDVPEDSPAEVIADLAREAARKAVLKMYPDDPTTDSDDRIREAMVIFFARSAQRTAETATGAAFTDSQVSMMEKVQIIREAMAFVQRFPGLTGEEKKKAVIKAVIDAVNKFEPLSQLEKNDIASLAASTIELVIDMKHGRFDLGQAAELAADVALTSCMNGWCCVPKKPKTQKKKNK